MRPSLCPPAAAEQRLAGEVGIFEMRNTGLEAVSNAAALFAPSAGTAQLLSDGSSRAVGEASMIIEDGARPLLIDIQALVTPRIRVVSTEPAQTGSDGFGDSDDDSSSGSNDNDGFISFAGEGGSRDASSWGDEGDDSSGDDSSGSGITGAGLMKGADRFIAAEAGVSTKEILPLVRHVQGLNDRTRLGMLLELLTIHTPIRVSEQPEGDSEGGKGVATVDVCLWAGCVSVGQYALILKADSWRPQGACIWWCEGRGAGQRGRFAGVKRGMLLKLLTPQKAIRVSEGMQGGNGGGPKE